MVEGACIGDRRGEGIGRWRMGGGGAAGSGYGLGLWAGRMGACWVVMGRFVCFSLGSMGG